MNDFLYASGDLFESIFDVMPLFGDYINYFFMVVIFTFLVVWTTKMFGHKKRGEEHASS